MGKSHAAFTLVETLVVVALAAVMLSLAYAGYKKVLRTAHASKAMSQIRLLGMAAHDYAADNDGLLPQSSHQGPRYAWTRIFKRSLPKETFRNLLDTTDRLNSYAINDFVTRAPYGAEEVNFSRLQSIPEPSQTLLFSVVNQDSRNSDHFHFASSGWAPWRFRQEIWTDLYEESGLYLFVDGHAEMLSWKAVKSRLEVPGTTFIRPDGGTLIHNSIQ